MLLLGGELALEVAFIILLFFFFALYLCCISFINYLLVLYSSICVFYFSTHIFVILLNFCICIMFSLAI